VIGRGTTENLALFDKSEGLAFRFDDVQFGDDYISVENFVLIQSYYTNMH
jgi:hypothetical protein